jgi:GTP1/Obg family GTP-binding protein
MNNIEKVAYLAIKLLAEKIIYVFDMTEPYPMKDQEELYRKLKELKKPITIYLSKTDILEKKQIEEFSKKHTAASAEQLKKLLL